VKAHRHTARLAVLAGAVITWLGAPFQRAVACPFCASGASGTGDAYLIATVFMLIVPLGLIGWFALWVRRSVRRGDASEGTDAPIQGDTPPRTGHRHG